MAGRSSGGPRSGGSGGKGKGTGGARGSRGASGPGGSGGKGAGGAFQGDLMNVAGLDQICVQIGAVERGQDRDRQYFHAAAACTFARGPHHMRVAMDREEIQIESGKPAHRRLDRGERRRQPPLGLGHHERRRDGDGRYGQDADVRSEDREGPTRLERGDRHRSGERADDSGGQQVSRRRRVGMLGQDERLALPVAAILLEERADVLARLPEDDDAGVEQERPTRLPYPVVELEVLVGGDRLGEVGAPATLVVGHGQRVVDVADDLVAGDGADHLRRAPGAGRVGLDGHHEVAAGLRLHSLGRGRRCRRCGHRAVGCAGAAVRASPGARCSCAVALAVRTAAGSPDEPCTDDQCGQQPARLAS